MARRSPSRSRSRSRRESETLTHRGAMRIDHPNRESRARAALERELAELDRGLDKLLNMKDRIEKRATKLGDRIHRIKDVLDEFERDDTLPTAVIHFVHLLEKANLYFEFKTTAKRRHNFEHCDPLEVSNILRRDEKLMSDFINIGNSDISNAATAIFWEPILKRTRQTLYEPALKDWIYRRVYHALRGDYVMDKDPEEELKKMMEYEPDVYDDYFLQLPENYKMMSKQEAYKKYSELVSIFNTGNKEALEEKRKSTLTTSARDSEAFDQNHKVTSTAISARNKEAVYAKHKVPKRKRDDQLTYN